MTQITTATASLNRAAIMTAAWAMFKANREAFGTFGNALRKAWADAKGAAAPSAQWAVEQAEAALRSVLNPRAFRCGAITIGTEGKVCVQFTAVSIGEGTADVTATFNTSLIAIEPVVFTMPTKAGQNGCGNGHFNKEVNRAIDQVKLRAGLAGQIIM